MFSNTQMKIKGFESNVSMHFPNLFNANSIWTSFDVLLSFQDLDYATVAHIY